MWGMGRGQSGHQGPNHSVGRSADATSSRDASMVAKVPRAWSAQDTLVLISEGPVNAVTSYRRKALLYVIKLSIWGGRQS